MSVATLLGVPTDAQERETAHMIIGVDFDGTIVENIYPNEGAPLPGAIETLKDLVERGHQIVLWTVRSGFDLDVAVATVAGHGVSLWGVNQNPSQQLWGTPAGPHRTAGGSPKAHCHIYIDDRALGAPLDDNGHIDWTDVRRMLEERGVL